MSERGRDFLRTYLRFCVIALLLALLACALLACAQTGDPVTYGEGEHTCVFGHWCDAAPDAEGGAVTKEVRYCKICHTEETREKE